MTGDGAAAPGPIRRPALKWLPASASLRTALGAWVEARIYVAAAYIVTTAVVNRLEPAPSFTPVSDGLLAWDGRWYELIAVSGYAAADDPAVRFFPLWPLVGRAVAWLPGMDAGVALVVCANLAALAAGVLLHRLVIEETSDPGLADRAVRLLMLAPPSFVLVLAYSEALYLVLALATFVAAGRGRWWAAAVAGYLAALTRPVGAILALPVAYSAWRARRDGRGPVAAAVAAAAAPLAGAATFIVWAGAALGDADAPIDQQRELRGDPAEPVSRLVRAAYRGARGDTGELFHFLAAAAIVALAVIAALRLSRHLALYGCVSALMLLTAENMNSLERYALGAFPLVIAAALVSRHPRLDRWLPAVLGAPMTCLAILAFHGVYVP